MPTRYAVLPSRLNMSLCSLNCASTDLESVVLNAYGSSSCKFTHRSRYSRGGRLKAASASLASEPDVLHIERGAIKRLKQVKLRRRARQFPFEEIGGCARLACVDGLVSVALVAAEPRM